MNPPLYRHATPAIRRAMRPVRRPRLGFGPAAAAVLAFAALAAVAAPKAPATPDAAAARADDPTGGDPYGSFLWPDLRAEFLGAGPVVFDPRVQVSGPAFAEDPMNVPITVSVEGLDDIVMISVLVDRNPIRKVLDYLPLGALPRVSFRFKLQQASPVRAAVKTRDGVWHVGGTLVDSAGGGCTVPGATRKDGSWSRALGEVSARAFPRSVPADGSGGGTSGGTSAGTRVRLRVMHPMDTGLAGGIPAFYINRLSLRDAAGLELLRLNAYEPVSENPVFSFDFVGLPAGRLQLVGSDNNGNRIQGTVE